jgi:diguanylate cyclase (GGDEF)-like protein
LSEIFALDANKHPQLSALLERIEGVMDTDPHASLLLINEAIPIALSFDRQACLGWLYCQLGMCHLVLFNPAAIRNFEAALEIAERELAPSMKIDALHGLGRTFFVFGEVSTALEYCERALQLAREFGESGRYPKIFVTLGAVFSRTGQFERSVAFSRDAAEAAASIGDKQVQALALNNWADVLVSRFLGLRNDTAELHTELLDEAIELAQLALRVVQQAGLVRSELMVAETMAHAVECKGDYLDAIAHLDNTLQRLQGHRFIKEVLDIELRKGALLLRLGRVAEAITKLTSSREDALKLGNYPHLADLLRDLCAAQEAAGDYHAALICMKELHSVELKQRDYRAQISAQIYAAKMDLERAQREVATHKNRVSQLEDFNRSLSTQAHEDILTGLPNRRALEESMQQRLHANDVDFVFVMCDIDFFKKVNDEFSHLIGDDVLRLIGTLIGDCMRSNDLATRIGGEEFALVLDHCKHDKIIEACERIRKIVESFNWESVAHGLHITLSFGVTLYQDGDSLKSLMERADGALYLAKRNGRNRTERA